MPVYSSQKFIRSIWQTNILGRVYIGKHKKEEKNMKTGHIITLIVGTMGMIGAIIAAIIIAHGTKITDPNNAGENLNFRNWHPWGGLQANVNRNTVTFNGKVSSAGYVNANINTA